MKKFAFLVHPRDLTDMSRPLPWMKFVPHWASEKIISKLSGRLGFIDWSRIDVFGKMQCFI